MERDVFVMYLRKALCSLIFVGILTGCFGGIVDAAPMEVILKGCQFQDGKMIGPHVIKLQEYMQEEKNRLALEGDYCLENIKRLDSLTFGIFCCFCYKNNLTGYIEQVVKQRVPSERREDMDVIEHILPSNPTTSGELYARFGMENMLLDEFPRLAEFIRQCIPKRKVARDGEPRKPGRRLREEMQRGLQEHQSGYDADYQSWT